MILVRTGAESVTRIAFDRTWPGRGDLQGREPANGDGFRYEYGKGDELQKVIDEAAGTVADTERVDYY